MTLKEAYEYSVYFLAANGVDEAEFKSLCVCCHLAGIKNNQYEQHKEDNIVVKTLADLLWRVKNNEPVQYVIGKWDFYESEFYVGEGVLIPRPETEELTQLVIDAVKKLENPVVYDLCSGSGCIGVSVAKACPNSSVFAVEKSKQAFEYLKKNSKCVNNITVINDDINNDIELPRADVIVCNPPYIKTGDIQNLQQEVLYEPTQALDGGIDGLDFYRIINSKWYNKLKANGLLFLEIGNDQGDDIKDILTNFKNIQVIKDIYNNDRMVKASRG